MMRTTMANLRFSAVQASFDVDDEVLAVMGVIGRTRGALRARGVKRPLRESTSKEKH